MNTFTALSYGFCNFSSLQWQCEDPRCQVWQHMGCVLVPEKTMEGNPPVPELFYCELCRLSRADPYVAPVFSCYKKLIIACYFLSVLF